MALAVLAVSRPADATDDEIRITFDELIKSSPGSVERADSIEVPGHLVGTPCTMLVITRNQVSVHPGNDLLVTTGSSQAVIVGVEDTANVDINQEYRMTLGSLIDVDVRIGQDGLSSLGFELLFQCSPPPPPPTVADTPPVERRPPPPELDSGLVTTTSTTAPTTPTPTPAPTDTTAAPAGADPVEVTSLGRPVAAQTDGGLAETPAAAPVDAQPNYTG